MRSDIPPKGGRRLPSADKLRVFISSKMLELRDLREILQLRLEEIGIDALIYEDSVGARPESVIETSLYEVASADIYVGLFWVRYGEITVQEYRHARELRKPCFIYVRDKNIERESALEEFLLAEVYDLKQGVTYDFFDSAIGLSWQVADDIMAWLVRRHREMTANIQAARASAEQIESLQSEVRRLQQSSRHALPQGTPADFFANQLRSWFQNLGYLFEEHDLRSEDSFEWVINIPARRGYERITVRGVVGEANLAHLNELRLGLSHHNTVEGWLVATHEVSPAAREKTISQEGSGLYCYTFDELLDEYVDFGVYFKWLEEEVKQRGIDKTYVPLAAIKDEFDPASKQKIGRNLYDERNGWIDSYIDRWIDDPTKKHLSILGEFGTGKTWFTLHYAWTLLEQYREAKRRGVKRPRIPLLIFLRDYAGTTSIESLFSDFFFRQYEIPLPGYTAFEHLIRMDKLLLILDGFDEMAVRIDRQKMINNFWELSRVITLGAKAILTSRIEYFPSDQESRKLLNAELQASTDSLTGEPPQFEVLELVKFSDEQIKQAFALRGHSVIGQLIMRNRELLDLARRPIMNELILSALPDIEMGKPVDISRVYLYAIRRKMEEDIRTERTFTSLADKLYFLCELSWEMLSTGQLSLNYRHFPDRIRRLFGSFVQEQKELDHWQYDMMGQAMLIRNSDGDYRPSHRSLLEFFVAYKFAAELGALAPDFTALAREQVRVKHDAAPREYTWFEYFQGHLAADGGPRETMPLSEFKMSPPESLLETFGRYRLASRDDSETAILQLLPGMVRVDDLWGAVESTKGRSAREVGYIGGNSLTILSEVAPLTGVDLSGAILHGARMVNVDLTGADLSAADLRESDFTHVTLTGANLSDADMTGVNLRELVSMWRPLAFHPRGMFFITGGYGYEARVWTTLDSVSLHATLRHKEFVTAVGWSPDGRLVATAGRDVLKIWDAETWQVTYELPTDKLILALEFGPDNNTLAYIQSDSFEDGLVVWQIEPLKRMATPPLDQSDFPKYRILTFHPNEQRLLCAEYGRPGRAARVLQFTYGQEGLILGQELNRQFASQQPLVCYTRQGEIVAADKDSLDVYRLDTLDWVRHLKKFDADIMDFDISPDGNLFAVSLARISNEVAERTILMDFATDRQWTIQESRNMSWRPAVARFSPDGTRLVVMGNQVYYVDTDHHSPTFGQPTVNIEMRLNYDGTNLRGVKGLSLEQLKFFHERGAITDDDRLAPTGKVT